MSTSYKAQIYTEAASLPTEEETILVRKRTEALQHQLDAAKTAEAAAHREYSKSYIRWKSQQTERQRIERQLADMYRTVLRPKEGPRATRQAEAKSQKRERDKVADAAKLLKGLSAEQINALLEMTK